jgi:OOP family OmpA-OmpF porin
MLQPTKWWIGLPAIAALAFVVATLETQTVETDIAKRVGAKLARTPGAIDHPQVAVEGRDVVISGVALDETAKRQALSALISEDGVRSITDATTALAVAKPFVVSFERKGKKIAVTGFAPPTDARNKIKAAAAAFGADISDATALAAGAPKDFTALAEFALAQLARLDPGKATLTDGALTLSGDAKSSADYEAAFAAARAAPAGVTVSTLEISPPRVSPYVWSAANIGAMIALSGAVPSNDLRTAIVNKAASIASGAAVSDQTQIGAGAPKGDFSGAVAVALAELGKLSQGKVTLTDAKLTIEGQGRANVVAAAIEEEAKANLPQGFEVAKVDVEAGPVSPYRLSARKDGASLTLKGYAADESQKETILATAKRQFFGANVIDEVALAKGAPAGFSDAAIASLRALARLINGKLDISGNEISLEGEAYYQKAPAEIDAGLASELPQSFKSSTRLMSKVPGSTLESAQCQPLFSDLLSKASISFNANDSVTDDSTPVLDALAAIALRCQNSTIEIGGYTDSIGIDEVNRDVSKRRAQAIVQHLSKAGADPFKLIAVGHGGENPIAANDSEENRARNRRIEFLVK